MYIYICTTCLHVHVRTVRIHVLVCTHLPATHFSNVCTFTYMYVHISQINNPCRAFGLGDKFAIFTLTLDDITDVGTVVNSYGVTFSNVADSVSVPETRVTGRGTIVHHSHNVI